MWESDLSVSELELFLSTTISINYFDGYSSDFIDSTLWMQIVDKIIGA